MRTHVKAPFDVSAATGAVSPETAVGPVAWLGIPAAVSAALLSVLLTLVLGASPAAAANCPNEIRRQEQGVTALSLPNCRAYEMVSPKTFPQQWLTGTSRGATASVDGNSYAYFEFYPGTYVDSSGLYYYSKRGAAGWESRPDSPQQDTGAFYSYECDPQLFYSADLSKNILQVGYHNWLYADRAGCKLNQGVLDPRESRGYRNLFLHDVAGGGYDLVSVYPEGATPSNNDFQAASPDLGTVVFSAVGGNVTPDDPSGLNYYIYSHGTVRLLGYLPDGTPFEGSQFHFVGDSNKLNGLEEEVRLNAKAVGAIGYPVYGGFSIPGDEGLAYLRHTVSNDGSKVFFYAGGNLYVRLNPGEPQSAVLGGICTEPEKACTVQIDVSQGPGPSGEGRMSFASADGSRVFFTSDSKLTADSTAEAGKEDLYEYDLQTGDLADLTISVEPANVQNVVWASNDGEYVYFVAQAALAPGASPAECATYTPTGFCNLYVAHDGQVDYIAALPLDDARAWGYNRNETNNVIARSGDGIGTMHSSPNGVYFGFRSSADLTAYESGGKEQLYLYDAATGSTGCVSCPAVGEPTNGLADDSYFPAVRDDGAQSVAGSVRNILDNGRIFFDTEDALVPADTAGKRDVYMYENGQRYLLSGGLGDNGAHFQDASPGGDNVFIVTAEPLLPFDTDGASSIYDARVGGGFPEPPPLPGCEGEACRGAATQPGGTGATGTAGFRGPGNQPQGHRRDCGSNSKRAQGLSKKAKKLRRRARNANHPGAARALSKKAAKLAKTGQKVSKSARKCRRVNRGGGK